MMGKFWWGFKDNHSNYTMSVFRLPKTLCREINSMMGKFWWDFKDNHSKIPWMSWSGLGRKKSVGGIKTWKVLIRLFLQNNVGD